MGFSILEVVRDNPTSIEAVGTTYRHPAGVLHLTQFTQVAMATLAAATVAEMREAGVFDPEAAVAGHSVGEYNALGASNGVLTLEGAIELVFARGQGMHGLVPRDAAGQLGVPPGGDPPAPGRGCRTPRPRSSWPRSPPTPASSARSSTTTCAASSTPSPGPWRRWPSWRAGSAPASRVARRCCSCPGIDVPFHSSALLGGVADFRKQLVAKLPEHIDTEALVGPLHPQPVPAPVPDRP